MTKVEIIDAVKTAISNNELTLEELAKETGLNNKLRNAADEQAVKTVQAIAAALELPPETPPADVLKAAEAAVKAAVDGADAQAENAANAIAGTEDKPEEEKKNNALYSYAKKMLNGKRGVMLQNSINALKEDPVVVALRGQKAAGIQFNQFGKKPDFNPFSENMMEV